MSGLIHSLPYTYTNTSSNNLGFLNSDTMSLVMDHENIEESDDVSTGYLEDALVEFSSKRRRLLLYANSEPNYHHDLLLDSYWNSYHSTWGGENLNYNNNYDSVSAEYECEYETNSPKSRSSSEDQLTNMNLMWKDHHHEMKTPEFSNPHNYYMEEDPNSSSSSSSKLHHPLINAQFLPDKPLFSIHSKPLSGGECETQTKKKKKRRVVYPFAMVKPGGVEGDMTLNDINRKILMPPTRPVRHPVGDFACRPCVSGDGTGLSGKAVVALTRIHTPGRRGTITIIRTKG